ncbi:MAG: hypothetical protein K5644_08985, partial [Lachnospiraceae bacterium]|nr:hypothetical protein [Lachnospiraceae bacterium]
ISGGTIFACSVGIENASSKRLNQSSGSITSNTYGVVNNSGATYIKSGGNIYSNTTGVINNNNATFTQSGGTISNNNNSGVENAGTLSLTNGSINGNNGTGVNNSNTFNMSGGTVNHNIVGINNSKIFNLTNGSIYNNKGYGIDNLSVVKHSGGSIYSNSTMGYKADTTDNCNIGVNQNGTYEMSGSAKVYSNSIFLLSNKLVDLTSSSFNGSAILTTATSDRVVGRELVKTNGAANYTKFSLAYGNDGTKTNAKYVKDSADSGSSSFTGNKALIRPGSSIIGISQSKSAYLSAEYSIIYDKNTTDATSPLTNYANTTFYWKETVAPLFGTNVYTKTATGNKSIGYALSSSTKTPTYTSNTTFNTASTVLKKATTYYAVWALSYKVHYDYNNGYGDEYTQTCNRDTTYNFISKPSNYKKPTITYNYNYDSKTQTINVDKTFNGWLRTDTSTLYQPNSSFNNLGEVNSTVNLVGGWSIKSVTLPTPERDGYEFKGWEEQESGTIYDGGDSYTPADDNPTTFIAIWEEADKYYVNYVHNNGYGDTELKKCNRDKIYQYADAPSRYVSAKITFDYGYDDVKLYQQTPKSFDGWSKVGSSVKYAPGVNFINLAAAEDTITLNGNWTIQPITFPDGTRDDYELIGWKIPGEDPVYPTGTTYIPKDDEPITFIAIWKPIDREVIFDPNGAVDTSGNLVSNVSVEKPAPLAAPFTLLEGTDVGGKKLTSDTTYFRGSINSDLVAYIPENNNKSSVQYRAKEGDIINNLGNAGTLAKFMGWSKTSSKSKAVNGTVDLTSSELFGAAAYANKQFTLYAVWDEFPILEAEDVLINDLDTVTQNDLLETVTVNDNEDNNLKSKVKIINYNEVINALKNNASEVSIIYEVTDSAGNTTRAFAIAKEGAVNNDRPLNVITKLVRSIDRHAYNTHDETLGGCLVNSPWYNNEEYVAVINNAFDNMDNNTPIAHYMLTQEERVEISEYIHTIGLQKLHSKELLNYIVANYMDSEHSSKDYEFADKPTNIGYTSTVVTGNALQERYERELDRLKALRNDMDLSRIYR